MGVMPDKVKQAFIRKCEVFVGQAGRFARALHQEPLGNLQLFLLRIARKPQDFHAVLKRLRNRMQYVGRAHEHHFRKVVLHVQVMVRKRMVQFRIEHFHQRR